MDINLKIEVEALEKMIHELELLYELNGYDFNRTEAKVYLKNRLKQLRREIE